MIVRTDRVGDAIMLTPMARELKRTFPECFVGILTRPSNKAVFENNPNIDTIIEDDLSKESFWNIVKEIRKNKFTHGLLVFPTERAAYQMFFGGVKKRYSTGTKLYGTITLMHSVSRNKYENLKHEADYCMDLARKIGVVTDNIQPEIFVTEQGKMAANNLLNENGINEKSFKIILHTGSKNSAPNWSEEKYLLLLKEIIKKYDGKDFKILLTALEMSDDFSSKAVSIKNGFIIDVSKKLKSLDELINLYSVCDIFVGSSTGPSHIADAIDMKSVTIFCHRPMNSIRLWGVLNKKSVNIEVSEEYCSKNCSNDYKVCSFENGLTIEEVIKYI